MPTPLFSRRQLLLASLVAAGGAPAWAQAKPTKIIVGFPPGQATDVVARMLAERLQRNTGRPFIVENMPGQGGSLALGNLAKAPADGSVMMLAHMSALCTNPVLYKSVPYDTLKDFEPVGLLGDLPFVLVCNPTLPVNTVQELVAHAKANPDKLNNASSGNGTVSHLAMEEFKRRAGVSIQHIPYKGSAAGLTDVMSGTVSVALETAAAVRPLVQAGKLRALAAGSATRLNGVLATVPTLAEQGFANFNAVTWLMLLLPTGAAKPLVQASFAELNTAARDPELEAKLVTAGLQPRFSTSPDEAGQYVRNEFKAWGDVVRRSGVTLE
jgi:tripartite-type tricarboxylate transporter receptor subunit TctC